MKSFVLLILSVLILSTFNALAQHGRKPLFPLNSRPGLINITELSGGFGLKRVDRDYAKNLFSITTIGGIGIAKNMTAGIGIGFSFYNGGNLQPLFADLRYFFSIGVTKLHASIDGGILLNSGKTAMGRRYILSPGAGILLPVSNNLALNFGASLFTQLTKEMDHDSFLNIKAGISCFFKKKRK